MNLSLKIKRNQRSAAHSALKLFLLASAFAPAFALAQNAPPADAPQDQAAAQGGGVEEIIVTAQRREEKLSKVPVSVLAVSPQQLESANVESALDLPEVAPGLISAPGASANAYFTPFIRGVGSSSVAPGDDASVATYIDGVYQADKQADLFDLSDIDHIEVLRGPQGTLFGRNSTGGAINIITKSPSFSGMRIDGEASYGSYDQTTDKIYASAPIIADVLAASISGLYREGGNFAHNAYLNSNFGGNHNTAVTFKLDWRPTDNLEITNSVFYNNDRERPINGQDIAVAGTIPLGGLLGGQYGTTPYISRTNSDFLFTTKNIQDILNTRLSLSGFDIVSTTSYLYNRQLTDLDYDTTTANVFFFHNPTATRDVSQEVQFLSTSDGPLTWVGGLYYMSDIQGQPSPGETINLGVPEPGTVQQVAATPGAQVIDARTTSEVTSYAAYAQATYAVTDQDNVTAGFRWTEEHRTYGGSQGLNLPGPNGFNYSPFFTFSTGKVFEKPTWRFSIDHTFNDDLMAYFSYNRGFKSGVYNTNFQTPNPVPVQPEKIDAFELGAKSKWFNNTLQLNAAAFYYQYSNIQVEQIVGFQSGGGGGGSTVLENAASAQIYGIDLDWIYVPTADLHFHGSLELLSDQYTNYANASGFALVSPAPGLPPSVGLSVPVMATNTTGIFAPPYSFTIGGTYTYHLPGDSTLVLDTTFTYQGKYKIVVGVGNYYNPYGQLNGSLTWNDATDRYYVRVWGQNIGDVQSVGRGLNAFAYNQILIPPAFYGVSVGFKFD